MYRVCRAINGYYYAQRYGFNGWKMFGPFCRTKAGARNVIRGAKAAECCKVIEYVY